MKTSIIAPVLALRVYESEREIITVNGTKTKRCGAIVFMSEVGGTKSVTLSAKQHDNLAGLAGVNHIGKEGWLVFKGLVGLGRSRAMVTVEEYKSGDEFVNADKTIGKHTVDGTAVQVEAIMLADDVVKTQDTELVKIANNWNKFVIPSLEAIKENELVGQN